jgi:hypothetical protein
MTSGISNLESGISKNSLYILPRTLYFDSDRDPGRRAWKCTTKVRPPEVDDQEANSRQQTTQNRTTKNQRHGTKYQA